MDFMLSDEVFTQTQKDVDAEKPFESLLDLFDFIATHLIKQGKPAMDGEEGDDTVICAYLSPTGLKCAIGAIIPKTRYLEDFEGFLIEELLLFEDVLKETTLSALMTGEDDILSDLLSDLQDIHDGHPHADSKELVPAYWKAELEKLRLKLVGTLNEANTPKVV